MYSPINVNATLHCGVNASELEWEIDDFNFGSLFERRQLNLRQIYEETTTTSVGTTYSSVIIFGYIRNNGTMICCLVQLGQDVIKSCTVLIVYGMDICSIN